MALINIFKINDLIFNFFIYKGSFFIKYFSIFFFFFKLNKIRFTKKIFSPEENSK